MLPVVPVKDVDEAIAFIRAREHPLAVYVFTHDGEFERKVFNNTKSGAAITNETVISAGVTGLPVGGVGASGYGYYTSKQGFDELIHWRVSLKNPGWVDKLVFHFRYPPYRVRASPAFFLSLLAQNEHPLIMIHLGLQTDYQKYTRGQNSPLPPRPAGKGPVGGAAKRWGFWLLFAFVGVSSGLLTHSKFGLFLKA